MTTQQLNGSELSPNPSVVETEAENLGTSSSAIPLVEGIEKIALAGVPLSIEGNSNVKENESESESGSKSENSESESSSAGSESSSSSGSDGDDDDDDDDDDKEEGCDDLEEGEISDSDAEKMVSWSMADVDGDDDGDVVGGPIKSMNELQILPPVPPVNVTLEPHHQMLPVGAVMSTLGAQVIVEGVEKHDPLNEGSILWLTESRKPLGFVDEIFGPVKNPYYVVRYNSEDEVPAGIHAGSLISFVPEFADRVLNNKDLYKKGYDASGANDEELSDEVEFSDDEKEAEYRRMQKMTKRGANNQNPSKRKNNRKKVLQKEHAIPTVPKKEHALPTIPNAPAAPMLNHGNHPPFPGNGQGHFGGTTTVPPFHPLNAAPNIAQNLVWTNNATVPQQPQPNLFPNGFPINGMPWYPQNTQMSSQLPLPGIQFQQQLLPSQGSLPTTMLPGIQPNLFMQPMYGQGLVGQNQMAFGLHSPFPHIQPAVCPAQPGFPSTENVNLQCNTHPSACPPFHPGSSTENVNLQSNTHPSARPPFHPGSSAADRGRNTFHGLGRKGW